MEDASLDWEGYFFKLKNMKALILKNPLTFDFVPRVYPNENDTLILRLRHEITNDIKEPNFNFTIGQKVKITITEDLDFFNENEKFEVEILNGTDIIYFGKLQTFKENTDIQNYEYKEQTNKRFDFK